MSDLPQQIEVSSDNTPHDVIDTCLLQDLPDAIFLIDPETSNILYVNRNGYESLGMEKHEVLHHSVTTLQADVMNQPQWQEIAQVIKQSEEPFLFVGRHKRKDGTVFPVEVRTSNLYRGEQHLFLSVARDISRRVILDEQLEGHKHSLWYALNEATDGIWEWNIQSNSLFISPKLKQMLGYGPEEEPVSVDFWVNAIHPDDAERVMTNLNEHLAGKLDRYEAIYRLKNRANHYIWVHDRGKLSEEDEQGNPLIAVGMVQNVTEQIKLQERLESQAARDELTGVFNRRICRETLEQQVMTSRITGDDFAILLIDIDHFKEVNDEYGHEVGDKVLQAFVSNAQKYLRTEDVLFRWGGEEFLALLPKINAESAYIVASKLRHNIEIENVQLENGELINLTVSIGVAGYPLHGDSQKRLFQNADLAMYRAKANGRNRVEIFKES
ncbi:sensor domain-containing diguanylate cyclase [Shewanella gelidii]|uniref:Diguanylate cyclase n=1 Tax=Shewanella gelidii TaxID=1642821 RepID=A0A917JPR8_9GAMM|nr:diguanylate cyclase [Shewanella gelidii]MCL1097614.1 diguanylate cyclase [Shewanella gelidii]GGI80187.1 hypothetical protein GCM10009332_16920 [Shewanella gelidii]